MRARTLLSSSSRWLVTFGLMTASVMVSARPAAAQLLQLQPTTISIASADPDTVPLISASPIRVTYIALGQGGGSWTITVEAEGQLVSGASTIPISNVSWVATPTPTFRNGTLSTTPQVLATGTGLALLERGDVTFRLANSWNYNVGTYTQTITFTLSSP
jgi:hypothetical protein